MRIKLKCCVCHLSYVVEATPMEAVELYKIDSADCYTCSSCIDKEVGNYDKQLSKERNKQLSKERRKQ